MLPRRLLIVLLIPGVLLVIGTIGYKVIEGREWTWLDALYMTVITLTTTGYGETHPLSPSGRVFTIFLCLGGIFTLFFAATELIRAIVSGEIRNAIGRRRMERSLAALNDHYLVCGYGRMGRMVCKEFDDQKLPYVVIDRNEKVTEESPDCTGIFVHGDATSDEVLHRVGVTRAKALVTVASSDADNLYIVLSARLLNPKLFIVARAEESGAEEKLRRVGADQVVSPYVIGGRRVAHAVLRPTVVDFIEMATRTDYLEMQIEEIRLKPGSTLIGQTIGQCRFRQELGVVIVAIKKANGAINAALAADTVLDAENTLVVLGNREQLIRLEQLAGGK